MNEMTQTEAAPVVGQSTALTVITASLPTILAADDTDILGRLAAEIAGFQGDVTTEKGRKEIASKAYKVAVAKQDLKRVAAKLKEGAQATIKGVNAEVSVIEERMDALRDQVRAPLDEFEEREKARVAAHGAAIVEITGWATVPDGWTAAQIAERIAELTAHPHRDRDWQEFRQRAQDAARASFNALKVAQMEATEREAAAAEAERAAAEEAERKRLAEEQAQREREERIAAEAAQRAKEDAERKAAQEAERQAARVTAERARIEAEAKAAAEAAEAERRRVIREAEEAKAAAERRSAEEREAAARREREAKEALERAEQEKADAEARARTAAEQAERDRVAAELRAENEKREAVEAERRRQEQEAERQKEEARKREANVAHRRKINREAVAAIMKSADGITEEQAIGVVAAIAKGQIPHTAITY